MYNGVSLSYASTLTWHSAEYTSGERLLCMYWVDRSTRLRYMIYDVRSQREYECEYVMYMILVHDLRYTIYDDKALISGCVYYDVPRFL